MIPFRVEIPESDLQNLRDRLSGTRWPQDHGNTGWERGVPQAYLRDLVEYWQTKYDWRAAERRLNEHPQFTTEIDGARVHFLHVRSPEPDARPLLLLHGWPGSVAEFRDIIGPLTDPVAHGGAAGDAFHLVIPSLPGHGFSGPAEPGWDYTRMARAFAELMDRLGYPSFLSQGGDHGAFISLELGRQFPDRVRGVHVNMLLTVPSGDPTELAALTEADRARLGRLAQFDAELSGYMKLQATRPRTIGYALTDSPVGQLAWIVEKFAEWTDSAQQPEDAVDRDLMLTNVMIYWLTGTAASSAHVFYDVREYMGAVFTPGVAPAAVPVPIGVAVFQPDFAPVRSLALRDHPTISHWSEFPRGGHFAAMEQPDALVGDIRAFARSLT